MYHEPVVFQKWRWSCLHRPSTGRAVDKQATDDVVHLYGSREPNCLVDQSLDPCSSGEMLTLDLLGIPLARAVDVSGSMLGVHAPMN